MMYSRKPVASASASASARESLPIDLLLEIIACSDVTTVVRFARTCRILRLAILDPAFRRRLALQSAADGRGFDPALLLGVSFLRHNVHSLVHEYRAIHTPSPTKHRVCLDTTGSLLETFRSVASRGSLLLLRRNSGVYRSDKWAFTYELRVCNTFTGHITSPPPITMDEGCPHGFLSVGGGDAGTSYELLVVVDKNMCFQTFSSKYGHWSNVHNASVTEQQWGLSPSSRPAVVIGRTVYWMSTLDGWIDCQILAVDVDAEAATTMSLPHGCFSTMMAYKKDEHLLLASVHGRLSLIVAERFGISMWTLAPNTVTWSRELLISRQEIEKPVGLVSSHLPFALEGFGERSGAIIVRMNTSALLRIDLRTKVVTRLRASGNASVTRLFLHEIDLESLLETMKSF